jgi:peptide/nickel transport system substrate-binding protein
MDANAVKFTVDSILDPNRKPASITKAKIDYVKSVDVIDPLTVKFNLKTPNNFFRETIATLRIIDPVYYKAHDTAYVSTHLNGTGPYMMQSWTPGESAVLVPSPTWRGAKPGLDKLTYKFILDASARVAAIQTGAVDIIRNATLDQLDQLQKDKAMTVTTVDQERAIFIGINQTKGFPYTDLRFRQALNYAVDVNTIIKTVLRGYAKRIPTILASKTFGYNGEIVPWAYDAAKAKDLIKQVNLPADFKLTYMVTTGNHPQDDQVGQAVADYIRAAGVNVDLKVYPSTEFLNIKNGSKLTDLWMIGWASGSFEGYDDMSWVARTKATLWGPQLMEDPISDGYMQQPRHRSISRNGPPSWVRSRSVSTTGVRHLHVLDGQQLRFPRPRDQVDSACRRQPVRPVGDHVK